MSSAFAPVWGYGVYILLARSRDTETLTEGIAFAALSLFELMNQPLIHIVDGFEHIQTVANSFRRIQEYLMSEEREDYRITPANLSSSSSEVSSNGEEKELQTLHKQTPSVSIADLEKSQIAASVTDASTGYEENSVILKNLSFDVPLGQTTMIFGPVGCGKSTMLRLLLGEMPSASGSVITAFSKAAFCPQTPWITWGSVRSNILGMSAYEKTWYDTVVQACALSTDFEELPNGDQTNTGTRGSRLSGGQQMRLSFARALYSRNPVIILDDVLTGLDRTTERSILDNVFGINGLLKKMNTTVVMTTNTAGHLQFGDNIIILNKEGEITQQGSRAAISSSDDFIKRLAKQPPPVTSRPELEISDETMQEIGVPLDIQEDLDPSRHTGDRKVYAFYAKIAGGWSMTIYLCACAAFVFGVNFPSVWLQMWTNYNTQHPNERIGYYLGVYGALAGITILGCSLADSVFNLFVIPRTSKKLHELLLTTTIR